MMMKSRKVNEWQVTKKQKTARKREKRRKTPHRRERYALENLSVRVFYM